MSDSGLSTSPPSLPDDHSEARLREIAPGLPDNSLERKLLLCASTHAAGKPHPVPIDETERLTVSNFVAALSRATGHINQSISDPAERMQLIAWLDRSAAAVALSLDTRIEATANADEQVKYLSFLSHDLRGGLNGILLMIEVLKHDLGSLEGFAEQLGDLDVMRRSVLETVSLMDRFVFAERFRHGMVKVRRDRLELRVIGDHLRSQFHAAAAENGITLTVEAEGVADSDRMLFFLMGTSLVANAVRFGANQAFVKLKGSGASWTLEVSDKGPGLSAELMATLNSTFDVSQVLTTLHSHSPAPATNGLGLKLVRLAANALGAKIQVSTAEPAIGTRIIVYT